MSRPATEGPADTLPDAGSRPDTEANDASSDDRPGRTPPDPFGSDLAGSVDDADPAPEEARVLVVSGLGHKNERHYGPLSDVAGETTLVCLNPRHDVESAKYREVPDVGPRPLRLVLLFFVALLEGYRTEYDAVASISLFPYGLYALALKAVYGYPASLGIIGIDLDHHARQWYGPLPRWAFRRFDAVSVPGPSHAADLEDCGVPRERIEILANAIDVERYRPADRGTGDAEDDHDYDYDYEFIWVGRFSEEKAPMRFVESLVALEKRDSTGEFRAVMVGDGPLRDAVAATLEAHGLGDRVDLPGWVDDPRPYYRRSATFVLTSRRDALPLVMLEAMASGLPPVVPSVGSVPDVVTDGENGIVVPDRDPRSFAAAMDRCLADSDERDGWADPGTNATAVRSSFSYEQAGDDWRRILATLVRSRPCPRPRSRS
ncbi:glycosyl transferase family 1 [Halobiforma lacisalsi AJ5]|uniref:Glycosyl transferase family 1 n=1 Tax=Natronobacterium lacisalsi AJ5 TaxID=358396 RepID=M0LSZ6_NATLA|nr:glycosyltransferase [Halobiforma lacisalsi]APW99330.1 glycosyl transferase family 1 [Halobiforma lacisalsi AJ5]EMA35240.1 group 1 glycosyl transferase [Halobiforma lacisalsi AJ5]